MALGMGARVDRGWACESNARESRPDAGLGYTSVLTGKVHEGGEERCGEESEVGLHTTVRRLKLGARSGHPVGIRCSTVISVVWDVETVDSVFECEVRCRYWIGTVFGTRACSKSEQAEAKREAVCGVRERGLPEKTRCEG